MLVFALLAACGRSQPSTTPARPQPAQPEDSGTVGQHSHDAAHGHGQAHHHGDDAYQHAGQGMQHGFSDTERFAAIFDNPERDAWQRPADVVRLLALAPGQSVVDLGAGTGYFLPHLAPAVRPGGQVLGLDAEPAMVKHMQERIAAEKLAGVTARQAKLDDPGLAAASVDRILVVNTWHHIGERAIYARKLHQALRPGGFVLIVDFTLETEKGPPRQARLAPERVMDELREAGFRAEVVAEELPDQYVVKGVRAP